ncbi:MAG TPA: LLM class F420-dependent oxidoreductase [Candidatus Acidoferrales bacterium]|nr:LLM class F420-dependent oxidoreductase [Candidatus Acidoferrales bacterium]
MHFGLMMFSTDYAIRVDELAREAEARGFESLWLPEHTHIPTSRRSPWPGGAELPKEYWHTHDPFVALATAAAVTKNLKVATGICLLIERDPITTAKEVASLDFLSNGRFLFGIGGGWNAEEMEHHGTAFKTRWKLLRERVEAMKKIWTEETPEYHGTFVNFDKLWAWPKPVQKPHPPIYLGGHSPQVLQRVVDYCDGWLPIGGRAGDLVENIKELRRRAEKAGRDPQTVAVTIFGTPADEAAIAQYRAVGVERATFGLPPAGRDKVLPLMDRYAEFARKLS